MSTATMTTTPRVLSGRNISTYLGVVYWLDIVVQDIDC